MDDLDEIKTCIGCMEIKTLRDYYFNKKDQSYFLKCKECVKAAARARFKEKQQEIQEQRKTYRTSPHGRSLLREMGRRARMRYPEKERARRAVQERLPPARESKCHHCSAQAEEWHHHNGYDREHRLDVIPLCKPCHVKADREQSQKNGSGVTA